ALAASTAAPAAGWRQGARSPASRRSQLLLAQDAEGPVHAIAEPSDPAVGATLKHLDGLHELLALSPVHNAPGRAGPEREARTACREHGTRGGRDERGKAQQGPCRDGAAVGPQVLPDRDPRGRE